jgi:hypothetical protein
MFKPSLGSLKLDKSNFIKGTLIFESPEKHMQLPWPLTLENMDMMKLKLIKTNITNSSVIYISHIVLILFVAREPH